MGWRLNLAKKNYNKAKKYVIQAKNTGQAILKELPTINTQATIGAFQLPQPQKIQSKPHSKRRKKRRHNIANVSDNYLNNLP